MTARDVLDSVSLYLFDRCGVCPGDHVVIAISGGPDSVAMSYLLNDVCSKRGVELSLCHVNHGLRGEEAKRDEQYCEMIGSTLGLPVHVCRVDVGTVKKRDKVSVQMAARKLRMNALIETADKVGAQFIAIAQHMDDQAETVLMRIISGAGLQGMAGILPIRDEGVTFIRPLLGVRRKQIERYLNDLEVKACYDKTNAEIKYERNKVRQVLLPLLEREFNPQIVPSLARTAELLRDDSDLIEQLADDIEKRTVADRWWNAVVIDAKQLQNMHIALASRVVLRSIFRCGGIRVDRDAVKRVVDMAYGGDRLVTLPGRIMVQLHDGQLVVARQRTKERVWDVNTEGVTEVPDAGVVIRGSVFDRSCGGDDYPDGDECWVDADLVDKLQLRFRNEGDRWYPLGMSGSCKLKDYMIDNKIPRIVRDLIPIIVNGDDIVWVVGERIDDRYKVREQTNRILQLSVGKYGRKRLN